MIEIWPQTRRVQVTKQKIRQCIRSLLLSHYSKSSNGRDFLCLKIEVSGLFRAAASFEILLLKKIIMAVVERSRICEFIVRLSPTFPLLRYELGHHFWIQT